MLEAHQLLTHNKRTSDHRLARCHGAPGRIRTCDQLIRRQLLYPLSYGGLPPDRNRLNGVASISRLGVRTTTVPSAVAVHP